MKRDKNKFDSIKIYLGSTSPFQNMVSHLEQITRINLILPSNANLYPPLNDISRLPNNTAISSLKFNRARATRNSCNGARISAVPSDPTRRKLNPWLRNEQNRLYRPSRRVAWFCTRRGEFLLLEICLVAWRVAGVARCTPFKDPIVRV